MKTNIILPKGRKSIPQELLQFGVHLVYSEGTKTEPFYIENIKKNIASKYNCPQNAVEIIVATGKESYSTLGLVSYAKDDVKKRLQNKEKIDHVWIFFDKDDFNGFEDAHEEILRQNNSKNENVEGFLFDEDTGITWHSCWSNECFELWLCLYFDYYHVPQKRNEYKKHLENQPKLKKINFKYKKSLECIHNILTENGGSIENAIKFAKKLEKLNHQDNPSTGVYQFVEYFNPYMKKD